jgi:molybdopterin synthase sulfur carrier subunit
MNGSGDVTAPVRLLYFAWLREVLGTGAEEVVLPAGVDTVAALLAWQQGRGPAAAAAFASPAVRCAVNQEFAAATTAVAPGDEVAFFPPVTGG